MRPTVHLDCAVVGHWWHSALDHVGYAYVCDKVFSILDSRGLCWRCRARKDSGYPAAA